MKSLDRVLGIERLHSLDAGFLVLESPTTPMHIGSLAYLEGGPLRDQHGRIRLDELRRLVDQRLTLAPRFRQRPQSAPGGLGRPVWVDDPDFDVADHVNEVVLAPPGGEAELCELFAHLMMRVLERSRPLWELWVVEGCADGSVVLIEKIHHVMMDGVSGIDVAMLLTDPEPGPGPDITRCGAPPAPPRGGSSPWEVVERRPPDRAVLLVAGLADELGLPLWLAAEPVHLLRNLWAAARGTPPRQLAGQVTDEIGHLASLSRGARSILARSTVAPRTALNQPVGRHRRYEHVEVDFAEVRSIAERFDCTVNDVALAAVAGGIRSMRLASGEPVADVFQVAVPVSTRRAAEHLLLGNRVAAFLVPLPVGEADPARRVATVRDLTRRRKAEGQADLVAAIVAAADRWPMPLVALAAGLAHHQPFANAVVTNVPGPPAPRYVLGARLLRLTPLVPLAGNLDLSVGIVSYDGELSFGCFADAERCPKLAALTAGITETTESLAVRAKRGSGRRKRQPAPRQVPHAPLPGAIERRDPGS
jgi:diacylglycerol O-acyltransferase